MANVEIHSARLADIVQRHMFTEGLDAGCGILVGRLANRTRDGRTWAAGIIVPSMANPGTTCYIVTGAWHTEAEARAHANRIWRDRQANGALCGVANCPR